MLQVYLLLSFFPELFQSNHLLNYCGKKTVGSEHYCWLQNHMIFNAYCSACFISLTFFFFFAMVSCSPSGWAIRVRCPVQATRDDSEDHWAQVTKEHRQQWINPDFEPHGWSHPKSKWRVPVASQNGPWSKNTFFFFSNFNEYAAT